MKLEFVEKLLWLGALVLCLLMSGAALLLGVRSMFDDQAQSQTIDDLDYKVKFLGKHFTDRLDSQNP